MATFFHGGIFKTIKRGVCLELNGDNVVNTESGRLATNSNLIYNHYVIGDLVPMLGKHYGQASPYNGSSGVSKHSMYTFLHHFRMYGRGL